MNPGRLIRVALVASWAVLPLAMGPSLADALHGASTPVRTLASGGLWVGWAVVLLATLVPRPLGLTALRVAAPAALAAMGATALGGHGSAVGIAVGVVANAVAFGPETGALFPNGAAYPNETRHLLRPPGLLLLGPLPLAWVVAVVGTSAGPLLLAAKQWAVGGLVTVVGVPAAVVAFRALDGLTRRWVVFVPAGLVLHDLMALADPVLFRRQDVATLRPAPADTTATDITLRSPGLALELRVVEPATVALARPGRQAAEPTRVDALLFTPTRPGKVLAEARERRIRVG